MLALDPVGPCSQPPICLLIRIHRKGGHSGGGVHISRPDVGGEGWVEKEEDSRNLVIGRYYSASQYVQVRVRF